MLPQSAVYDLLLPEFLERNPPHFNFRSSVVTFQLIPWNLCLIGSPTYEKKSLSCVLNKQMLCLICPANRQKISYYMSVWTLVKCKYRFKYSWVKADYICWWFNSTVPAVAQFGECLQPVENEPKQSDPIHSTPNGTHFTAAGMTGIWPSTLSNTHAL